MKRIIVYLLCLVLMGVMDTVSAQEIAGTVVDEKKEPLPSAVVQVYQGNVLKGGTVTDYDGNYSIKPLQPGTYDVLTLFSGYDSVMVVNVVVKPYEKKSINVTMKLHVTALKCVTVTAYKIPIIEQGVTVRKMGRECIKTIPTTEVSDLMALAPGASPRRRGLKINFGGARAAARRNNALFLAPSKEEYKKVAENDFKTVAANPRSTMSVDVDRASYSNVRRFINDGALPPVDAVRVEEMINYFAYDYPEPEGKEPMAIATELTDCPWQEGHKLLHIGMQAKKIHTADLPPSNLVFLIDVSGSMEGADRLPLLKDGLKLLVQKLRAVDHVAIVTYAGSAGLALPSTAGNDKTTILNALNQLRASGSTAGGEGIQLAYKVAAEHFITGGNNRVLLATDGDFNVGISNDNELEDLITKKRESGIYLTCLGFGTDNYKDAKMEMLADKGNGNYAYIDNIKEAEKTLVSEFGGTLFTVAKDVKSQIEFNPAKVQSYRLVGYENRLLNTEDFNDDKKDAGDIGAGHTVTIIYELIPVGVNSQFVRATNKLKYQVAATKSNYNDELATVKFRYKKPDGFRSKEMTYTIPDKTTDLMNATENSRFATSVAMFGLLLKDSKYKGSGSYGAALKLAQKSAGQDNEGYRAEYIEMVKTAKKLANEQKVTKAD